MDVCYNQTNKLVREVQGRLQQLASIEKENLQEYETQIQDLLDQIASNCDRLNILVNKEPPQKRQNARIRVDQVVYDYRHLLSGFQSYQYKRQAKELEERQREELLNKKFSANTSGETTIMIDHALQHNTALHDSSRGLDDLLGSGNSIIQNLREQRVTLKGAHKRILDIANTLGLSNTIMRLIDKRGTQDKWIVFGGMIVTGVIMFVVWNYLVA